MNDLTVNGDVNAESLTCTSLTCDELNGNVSLKTVNAGNITGNITGDFNGDVAGDFTGNVNGDFTGNITGDFTGNVTGDFNGNIAGNLDGTLSEYNNESLLFDGKMITFTYNGKEYDGYVFGS